jgi:hypothetical protein
MNRRAELTKRIRQTQIIGTDLSDIITKGSPAMGWEGDPFLMVCLNKQLNRIEIWDERNGTGKETLVGSAPFDPLPNPYQMVEYLLMRDMSRKSMDQIVKEIDDHNDKIIEDEKKKHADRMEEAEDKVALAHHKEIGGYRGRIY